MNLSEIFIRRPIATSLLMAAIALFGVVAYRTLPVSDLPSVDFPTLNVNANLPGADPATMASSVATVLERQFTTIAGLDSMTSSSGTGQTQITLQFSLDRDIDSAAVDVQTAIAEVTPLLPPGMPSPPSFKKNNPADQPIMQLTITSPTLPMSQLNDYAENIITPRLSMINGVSQVQVQGQQKYAVRVQVDPDKLVSKRIGLNEVDTAIANWNPNLPTGTLYGPQQTYTVTTNAELKNAAQFANLIVSWGRNGAPVRLGEIADVVDSVQDTRQAAWMYSADSQQRSIQLQVMRQPGANTIAVTDAIREVLPVLQEQIPVSANVRVRFDRSRNIRDSFKDIQVTMIITLVLVIGVIFVFLRNASATIIPSMALPFALLGTFAVMAVLSYSLDQLSLMALILSIGFVVDDAIVMLENIMRHIEHGEEPFEAALKGSKEIGFTIISMTVSLAAVFIPVLFMSGILGRLFREFAVTITTAILVSGVVSITLTPMLCSRFLRVRAPGTEPAWSRAAEWCFQKTLSLYDWSLRGVLRWRPLMLVVFFAVMGLTYYLFKRVPTGFIPDTDQDTLQVQVQAAQGTAFPEMVKNESRLAEIIRKDPNVEAFLANVNNGNYNQMQITLKPRKERPLSAQQLVDKLRPRLSNFAGFKVFMNLPPSIRIGGRQSNSSYQFTLQGIDTDELFKWAQVMEDEVGKLPEVLDVSTDLQIKNPLMTVKIDRERAALYGLNAKQIENALYSAYGPELTSNIYTTVNQYQVLEEMKPKYQQWTEYLSKIYFKAGNGQLVPLDSLAKVTPNVGPQSIAHSGELPSVTVSFNLKTGVSLGTATDKVTALAAKVLPQNITAGFSGNAQMFQASMQNLTLLLIVAIGVVYIVLGVLYESYIHPITILSGLPSAGVGALLTLILFKNELNIYSFVGLIMLVGIVKKNAIMQIDFALDAERKHGKTPSEAIYEGCLIRFRPIMMTTMAAMLGAVPLALGFGAGGESRRPLGLVVVGGLFFSQLMTLYLTPVVYTYLAATLTWFRSRKGPAKMEPQLGFGD